MRCSYSRRERMTRVKRMKILKKKRLIARSSSSSSSSSRRRRRKAVITTILTKNNYIQEQYIHIILLDSFVMPLLHIWILYQM
jgi:hypothetical protein